MSKNKQMEMAGYLNHETYKMYRNEFRDLVLDLFEWEGLPPEIDKRYLELTMLERGFTVFFKDDEMGYLALPATIVGYDLYQNPVEYQVNQASSINPLYRKDLTQKNAVIIYNRYSREPLQPIIDHYARRLFEITRTQDVNVQAQKTPVLITGTQQIQHTLKNLYLQYDGNAPVIFGDKQILDASTVGVLKTDAPYVADKLQVLKNEIKNEFYTRVGISNAKQDKKERLVEAEVSANDEQVEAMRNVMLSARRDACKRINEMFGLNLSVRYKVDLENNNNSDTMEEMEE